MKPTESIEHNLKKNRPAYKRYIKGKILELHGLRSEGSFDADISRFDDEEKQMLKNEILRNVEEGKKTKCLCIIPTKLSGLPHITFLRNGDKVQVTLLYRGVAEKECVDYAEFATYLPTKLDELYAEYPELWVVNRETTKDSIFIRYSYANGGINEYIEIVNGNGIRDFGSINTPSLSVQKDAEGYWSMEKSGDNTDVLEKVLARFRAFLFEFKQMNVFEDWEEYVKSIGSTGFSLDFRLTNDRFDCVDYDVSKYKRTILDGIKLYELKYGK